MSGSDDKATRLLFDGMRRAADVLVKRATRLESYAAKNAAAGIDDAAQGQLQRAAELRRIAVFLVDPRLLALIRQDQAGLATILQTWPDKQAGRHDAIWRHYAKPPEWRLALNRNIPTSGERHG